MILVAIRVYRNNWSRDTTIAWCISVASPLSRYDENAHTYVSTYSTSTIPRWPSKDRQPCVPGAICWLASIPVCEVNRPRDKGWRLTSAVIRLCGSATMVIERDNERPPTYPRKCAGEMLDLLLRRSRSTIPRHHPGILDDVRAWMFQRDAIFAVKLCCA